MKSKEEYEALVARLRGGKLITPEVLEAATAIEDLVKVCDFKENLIYAKTPLGHLIARPSFGEPDFPGIWVMLRRPFIEQDLPLVLVEFTADEADVDGGNIITRVYGDALGDEYTDRVVHRGIERYFEEADAK